MTSIKRNPAFQEEKCDLCGDCFHNCPVMQLPIETSKKEVSKLKSGQESMVLSKCNTCFSCNLYCPQQANPYQLILEGWNRLYKRRGTPPLYRFVCPTEEPNIWQTLNRLVSKEEREWFHEWMTNEPKPQDIPFLIGNYLHLFPFIIGGSSLLKNFILVDRIDQWEGGAYLYQGGYLEVVQQIALNAKEDFDKWGVKEIVASTDSVEYQFSTVHPKEMNVKHNQKFISFNDWLVTSLKSNKIDIPNAPLNLNVTIHDNCYSKVESGKYWSAPREILSLCGCKITEMKHNKKDSLCCGFGAGASWVKNMAMPFDIISEGVKKFQEAYATGAKALISYCSGCIYLLWATKELLNYDIDLYHIIEVVRMAMGEKLDYPRQHVNRAWDVIAIITYQLTLSMFQKNFFIRKLRYDKSLSTYKPKRHLLLQLIRFLFRSSIIRKFYRKFFQTFMPIMNTR